MNKSLILIVDDTRDSREMYAHSLSQDGFEVTLAGNGQEALDQVSRQRPDLIIMDLLMPIMDGCEATRRLKADEKTKQIPIIILTAHYFDFTSTLLNRAEYAGILFKPCRPQDMIAEVARVLNRQRANVLTGNGRRPPDGQRRKQPVLPLQKDEQMVGMGRLVLLVDDSADEREMYALFLYRRGFRVASASNAAEALNNATELHPDLIVMDLSLPGVSGLEAARQLRTYDNTKSIPIVILTAYPRAGAAAVIISSCEGCLIKPCLPGDLLKEIVRVLERLRPAPEPRDERPSLA